MTTVGGLVLPSTDKESYVKRYPVAERCRGGSLPARGVMIDESSGSSGTPYNWVRAAKERRASHLFISHFTRYCFGGEPWVTINAFSMGAWATGINMGVALERNGLLKNTGPDIYKILGTLEFIGPDRRYLIRGYPPFLKLLIDEARHNPLQHHITINDDGELIFTISPAVQASSRRALPTMSTMRAESCDSTR